MAPEPPGGRLIGTSHGKEETMEGKEEKEWEPRHVLVGYDGSEGAGDSVRLVRALVGGTAGAEALLVNVLPWGGGLPVAYRLVGYDEAPAWKNFFRAAEEELAPLRVAHRTYAGGSPAKVLNDIAEHEDIDLVVVGSPHRGAIGRTFLGSVAEGLLHGASVAVVAAPRGYRERVHDGFARIVVGYDGSAEAELALRRGAALASRAGIELRVICVSTTPVTFGPFVGPLPPAVPDAREIVARAVRSFDPDVEVVGKALEGSTAVRPLAESCGPDDLLMVGSRSYGPLMRTLLGSVSSALIHAAPCPVLVVPRPHQVAKKPIEATGSAAARAPEMSAGPRPHPELRSLHDGAASALTKDGAA
ncbi:MAG: universal stress protein [Actinobacteria bacterium]|nr:universal stress protein [Actinomycetota bacterium]